MYRKHQVVTALVAASCLLMTAIPSHAARIYNLTTVNIEVNPGQVAEDFTNRVVVEYGQRSESVNWPHALEIVVWNKNQRTVQGYKACELGFGGSRDMQG